MRFGRARHPAAGRNTAAGPFSAQSEPRVAWVILCVIRSARGVHTLRSSLENRQNFSPATTRQVHDPIYVRLAAVLPPALRLDSNPLRLAILGPECHWPLTEVVNGLWGSPVSFRSIWVIN